MAVHPSLQDEAKFSEFHQLYKFDYNDTVWQSSTLFGLTRSDEACLKFIAYGLVLTPTAICGTLGNLLTIIILTRKCMRSPINCLLCGQAFSDLLLCCVSIPLLCFSNIWNFLKLLEIHDGYFSTTAVSTHMHTLYSVAMTCVTSSIYLSTAVTIERYVAVCNPFKAKTVFTCRRATCIAVSIIVFSILYNLPRWWEYELLEVYDPVIGKMGYRPMPTSLRTNYFYSTFFLKMAYNLFILTIPLIIMITLNAKICITVSRANKNRQSLSSSQNHENSVAKMLVIITSIIIVTYTCSVADGILKEMTGKQSLGFRFFRDFLAIFACSINFVVYCVKSAKFRAALVSLWPSVSTKSAGKCVHSAIFEHTTGSRK